MATIDSEGSRSVREALLTWIRANGIDPAEVPEESDFRVTGPAGQRLIHYTRFVRDADGCIMVDPDDAHMAWRKPFTAPCTTEPPAWLRIPGTGTECPGASG